MLYNSFIFLGWLWRPWVPEKVSQNRNLYISHLQWSHSVHKAIVFQTIEQNFQEASSEVKKCSELILFQAVWLVKSEYVDLINIYYTVTSKLQLLFMRLYITRTCITYSFLIFRISDSSEVLTINDVPKTSPATKPLVAIPEEPGADIEAKMSMEKLEG